MGERVVDGFIMADRSFISDLLVQLERVNTVRAIIRTGEPATALVAASRVAEILAEIGKAEPDEDVAADIDICRDASIPYFAACYGGLRLNRITPHLDRVVNQLEQSLIATTGRAMTMVA